MDRAFTNILSADVDKAAKFYQNLLGMLRHYDSDWFVVLTHPNMDNFEFSILDINNDIVPNEARGKPQGIMLTFVVKDVFSIHKKAKSMQIEILEEPTNMPYGQCRMLLKDIDGTILDISSPT